MSLDPRMVEQQSGGNTSISCVLVISKNVVVQELDCDNSISLHYFRDVFVITCLLTKPNECCALWLCTHSCDLKTVWCGNSVWTCVFIFDALLSQIYLYKHITLNIIAQNRSNCALDRTYLRKISNRLQNGKIHGNYGFLCCFQFKRKNCYVWIFVSPNII